MMRYQLGDALSRTSASRRDPVPSCKKLDPCFEECAKPHQTGSARPSWPSVMGVLIISFGVWGIADIFTGFGQSTLAKIGSTEISTEQFRQLYNDRLQQIGRQFGRPLTMDQARAFGLDRQVLQQVIAEAALDEDARRKGLGRIRCRDHAHDHERSQLQGRQRRLRSGALPGDDPAVRLHRAALYRRTAAGVAAPPDRQHDHRGRRAARKP